jgi:hypothetical protein
MAPVAALLVLAPWVGEYLLGNLTIGMLIALPLLVPLYGGGALLVRELSRRSGRGWPTILLLATAYGVIEAGLVDQSLFNVLPEEVVTYIPAFGIDAQGSMALIVGHAVWSIAIPIAIVEMLVPGRRTKPWLGNIGLGVTAALYLLGCFIIFQDVQTTQHFMASSQQLMGVALVALGLVVAAFVVRKRKAPQWGDLLPPDWTVGIAAFILAGSFMVRAENWLGVLFGFGILVAGAGSVLFMSRQEGWGVRHEFALVAGALPVYALLGFVLTALVQPEDTVAWFGNLVFAIITGVLLGVLGWRVRRTG